MPPAGFEPATPASDGQQTLALDRSATGIVGNQTPTVQSVAYSLFPLSLNYIT